MDTKTKEKQFLYRAARRVGPGDFSLPRRRAPADAWRARLCSNALLIAFYLAATIALDRVSGAAALSGIGFTLWDPTPACGLALLLTRGPRLAPLLLVAGILADAVNGGFSGGLSPALAIDAIQAAGCLAVAGLVQRFAQGRRCFQALRDMTALLVILSLGDLAISFAVGLATMSMQAVASPLLLIVCHLWVGTMTGIVGLLAALLTAPQALAQWQDTPPRARLVDIAVFLCGVAGALWLIFGVADARDFQFFYLLLLPVIWISARHGVSWCAMAVLAEQSALIAVVIWVGYPATYFVVFQTLSLAIAGTGLVLGMVVTEQRTAERRLRQHQAEVSRMARIATVGALGAAIIHELSQPLATMATYAHACRRLLRASPTPPDLLEETAARLEAEAIRAGVIIARLRDFVSRKALLASRFDLAPATQRVVAALMEEARSRDVDIQVAGATACCVGDPVQIELVLVNLIRNAIEAAASRGARPGQVTIALRQALDCVEVAVEDNGPGISPEIAGSLFEPFTTCKPCGIGLGLTLSRDIVKAHGGALWLDPAPRQGARFVLNLPREGPAGDG